MPSHEWHDASSQEGLKRMIGETIIAAELKSDYELHLVLGDGRRAVYETEADCCSQTWIEHFTAPIDLDKGAVVVGAGESEPVEWDGSGPLKYPDDVTWVYHTAFVTTRGEIIIEYRNSSNGFYGGSLRLKEIYRP